MFWTVRSVYIPLKMLKPLQWEVLSKENLTPFHLNKMYIKAHSISSDSELSFGHISSSSLCVLDWGGSLGPEYTMSLSSDLLRDDRCFSQKWKNVYLKVFRSSHFNKLSFRYIFTFSDITSSTVVTSLSTSN